MQWRVAVGVGRVKIQRGFSLRTQHVHDRGVSDGFGSGAVLAIAGGKTVSESVVELVASLFAQTCDQGIVQVILPQASRLNDSTFDFTNIEARHPSRLSANCDKNASQGRVGQVQCELRADAVERLHQDLLGTLADLCTIVFSWHIDQARKKAAVTVAPHEQPGPLTISVNQDSHRLL